MRSDNPSFLVDIETETDQPYLFLDCEDCQGAGGMGWPMMEKCETCNGSGATCELKEGVASKFTRTIYDQRQRAWLTIEETTEVARLDDVIG